MFIQNPQTYQKQSTTHPNNPSDEQRHEMLRNALAKAGRPEDYENIVSLLSPPPEVTHYGNPGEFKWIRVGIVGGGLAGMASAFELRKLGFDITIFEPNERIGGRIYTHYFDKDKKLYGEFGADRKDVRDFYKRSIDDSKETYDMCTDFLLEYGILARPPYVTMPKGTQFVEEKGYMKGFKLFGGNRSLNTIEIAHIYNVLEANVIGIQLMTGFAQVAKESEVSDYFIKGKELAKKIVSNFTEHMQQSDIQTPSTWAGRTTDSKEAPFSDKMMMFCSTLLSSFGLGANAIGTSLSLRSNLPMKLAIIAKDTYQFASEGGQIMIKHMWLEEPPQMEGRNELTKVKK